MKKKSGIRIAWISTIVLLLILAAMLIPAKNRNRALITYNYLFKIEHFGKGEKLYLKEIDPFDGQKYNAIDLYRMIRPMSVQEIKNLDLSEETRLTMLAGNDTTIKPYLILMPSSALKVFDNTRYVGIFQQHTVEYIKLQNIPKCLENFYSLIPDKNALVKDEFLENEIIPKGFVFANDNYYLQPAFVTHHK